MKPAMKEVLIGILTSIGILFGTIAVGLGAFQLVALVLGTTVSWPANDFPHRTTLIFSTLAGGLTMIAFANKFSNQAAMMFAGWLLLLIVSVASLIYLPDAANTFLAPTLVASMLLLVMSFLPEPWRPWLFVLALIGVLPSTLGVIYLLEQSQRLHTHCRNNALYWAVHDRFCAIHCRCQIAQLRLAGLPWQFRIDSHDCLDAALFAGAPPARQYSLLRRHE